MPMKKRTAVVTEAVCCFSPLFLGKNWSKFSLLFHFLRVTKSCCFPTLANEMRTHLCAKENATEMCMPFFKRERENGARVRRQPSKSFRRRKCFLFLSFPRNFIRGAASGFREAKPSSPLFFKEKLTLVLSFLCAFSSLKKQKKKWEKQALNQNGKPLRVKMHVKTNDKVIVIAGADKGKVTEVVEVFTKNGQILCKDVNIKTKHVKPRNEGESGSIIQREFPIHHSNVMHYSAAEKKRSRVGKKMEGDKKVRVLKATGEVLAN